ncbi:MAG: class I SAM-dependent methyltransferase, partial [Treponema sp.]
MNDWFENEAFWTQYAPVIFDSRRWAEAPTVAREILAIAEREYPHHKKELEVLDAGCGLGRIAVELAAAGAKVTGVDLIRPFLAATQASAEAEGVSIELVEADLRQFVRQSAFDLAINVYTSFGYCKTPQEDLLILKNIAQCLKPQGIFILEMIGREIAVRDFTKGEQFERAGYTVHTEFTVEGAWEGLRSRWILYSEGAVAADHCFVQRLYSA